MSDCLTCGKPIHLFHRPEETRWVHVERGDGRLHNAVGPAGGCDSRRPCCEKAEAEEREACAKLCDELVAANRTLSNVFGLFAARVGEDIARAIRARGVK